MKNLIIPTLFALTAGFAAPGFAAEDHGSHAHPATMPAPAAEAPLTEGIIKKIDRSTGKVTVSHGPLPNGMPAMTMTFKLKDASWIKQMQEGQKILFAADEINGAMMMIRFKPVKQAG